MDRAAAGKTRGVYSVLLRKGLRLVCRWTHGRPARTHLPTAISTEPGGGLAHRPGLRPEVTVFKQFTNETHCQKPLRLVKPVDELFRFSEHQIVYTGRRRDGTVRRLRLRTRVLAASVLLSNLPNR